MSKEKKVKLLIEIDEGKYDHIKNGCLLSVEALYNAIANGTPYNPSGDSISREDLKAAFEDTVCIEPMPFVFVKQIIDNATPIDIWQIRQEATKNALKKAEEMYKRPKGKWIKVKEEIMSVDTVTIYKCSECERVIATLPSKLAKYYPFCHCGADMRGGAK